MARIQAPPASGGIRTRSFRPIFLTAGLLVAATLSACSSSDDDDNGNGGQGTVVDLKTVSGNIRESGGNGLPGVTIRHDDGSMAVTDAFGNFILVDLLPSGSTTFEVDGSTVNQPGKEFPTLEVMVDLVSDMPNVFPQPITLPDLLNAASAAQTVTVDGLGATIEPIAATGAQDDIQLNGPTGTVITIDGVPATVSVDINVTPVPANEVPMPLPGNDLVAASYVTIQPGGSRFSPALDVVLPNDLGFPIGTEVDIWSFDHDLGAWVNRTLETGNSGIVEDDGDGGTRIVATEVISEGGWHAPVRNVSADCATSITGHVLDNNTEEPIAGASVSLSTGQFTMTDDEGMFSFDGVPAYDVAAALDSICTPLEVTYEIVAPAVYGSASYSETILSGSIVTGGTTDLGDVGVSVPMVGAIAGMITGYDGKFQENVTIEAIYSELESKTYYDLTPNEDGSFFVTNVYPGDYRATYWFADDIVPTVVEFEVAPTQLTTFNIQRLVGTGSGEVTILVMLDNAEVAEGAKVMIVGSDSGSSQGLAGLTDESGEVTFENVDGPFTLTAQMDVFDGPGVVFEEGGGFANRYATTLFDIEPSTGTIGLFLREGDEFGKPIFLNYDAELSGTVSNFSLGLGDDLSVRAWGTDELGNVIFSNQTSVDFKSGDYSMSVPSGVTMYTMVTVMDTNDYTTKSLMFGPSDLGPLDPETTLDQDFDYSGNDLVAFDQSVSLTFTDGLANPEYHTVFLCFEGSGNFELEFLLAEGEGSLPSPLSVSLPSLSHPSLAGFDVEISTEQEAFDEGYVDLECQVALDAVPTSLDFAFAPAPGNLVPSEFDSIPLDEFETQTLGFSESVSPADGVSGFNQIRISGGFQGFQGDFGGLPIRWTFWLPEGTSNFQLPPTVDPMLSEYGYYYFAAQQVRFTGTAFDVDEFFTEDVLANFSAGSAAILEECSSSVEVEFMLGEFFED